MSPGKHQGPGPWLLKGGHMVPPLRGWAVQPDSQRRMLLFLWERSTACPWQRKEEDLPSAQCHSTGTTNPQGTPALSQLCTPEPELATPNSLTGEQRFLPMQNKHWDIKGVGGQTVPTELPARKQQPDQLWEAATGRRPISHRVSGGQGQVAEPFPDPLKCSHLQRTTPSQPTADLNNSKSQSLTHSTPTIINYLFA